MSRPHPDTQAWLANTLVDVPDELARRVEHAVDAHGDSGGERDQTDPTSLLQAGLMLLEQADPGAKRDPEAAFDLLAADGLLTLACRAALEEASPENALVDLLRRAAHRLGEGSR